MTNPPRVPLGEGDHSAKPNGGGAAPPEAKPMPKLAWEEMSEKFKGQGGEIYLPAKK